MAPARGVGPAPNAAFDYIVVGAGSAGCTLAARLTESGKYSVLLVEAGESDRHLWVRVPLGVGKLLNDERFVWKAHTEAEAELHGNRLYWPSGRILGGSSSVNGMLFVRGHPAKARRRCSSAPATACVAAPRSPIWRPP
jgi:choline dehydrogenase